MAKAKKLGEILVELGYLTPEKLNAVLMHQRQWGVSLGRAAVAKNFCTEAQVLEGLSKQLGFPVIDLDNEELNTVLAGVLPQKDAEKHHAVPIKLSGARGEVLVVAMAAPATVQSQDAVLAVSKKARLQIFLANDEAVHRAIGRVYRGDQFTPMSEDAMWGNREQLVDPAVLEAAVPPSNPRLAAIRPPAPASAPANEAQFAGLTLSADCKKVLTYGADVRKMPVKAIMERVLEDWAARQLQQWAKSGAK
jgi:hypothetical protein